MITNVILLVIGYKVWLTLDEIKNNIATMERCISIMHKKSEHFDRVFEHLRRFE